MAGEALNIARFVERQMRNWELARQQTAAEAVPSTTEPVKFYIAISREVGSEGEKVAECLSRCLGWSKYDREILDYMAEREEIRRRLYELLDERQRNWLHQLLEPLEPLGGGAMTTRDAYFTRLTEAIVAIAQQEHAIFVGRGANFILPTDRGLAVRIVAPLRRRVQRTAETEGLDERAARERIEELESQRADFLAKHFGRWPYDPRRYDVVLNAASFSIEQMCEIVRIAARHKSGSDLPE